MNRIDLLFKQKKRNILSVYYTAGYPCLEDTTGILRALQKHGADLVEIGIPFSDPLADGEVLQMSNRQALRNGMTLEFLFRQLEDIRKEIHIPLILMGYLNPVLRFGMERFCSRAADTGIDGIILPDLPPEVYKKEFINSFREYALYNIFLITPETSDERVRTIDEEGNGFIYLVSSSSTTGGKSEIGKTQKDYFRRIRDMNLRLPGLAGFGISSHETFATACRYSCGAIVGSAFVKALSESKQLEVTIKAFISDLRIGKP